MDKNYIALTNVVREYHTGQVAVRAAGGITFSLEKGKIQTLKREFIKITIIRKTN